MKNQKNLIWLILISIVLSGCGNPATASAAPDQGITPCSPNNNDYVVTPVNQNLLDLYDSGVRSIGNSIDYDNIRQRAFNELVNHIYHLSDSVDIQTEQEIIRITITYISPELIHIIVVNHYLYKRYTNFSGRMSEQVQSHIAGIAESNNHVFFMTFTASSYDDQKTSVIDFPLKDFKLINTNNTTGIPLRDDHNLENTIILSNGPEYGFFYYPMAVVQNGACKLVLDKRHDTRVVLGAPNIIVNDKDIGALSWEYKFAPLIDMRNISGEHQNKFTVGFFTDQFSPKTVLLTSMPLETTDFWSGLARIIWMETTQDP